MDLQRYAAATHYALFQAWEETEVLRMHYTRLITLPLPKDFRNLLWIALKLNWQPCRPEVTPKSLTDYVLKLYPRLAPALLCVLDTEPSYQHYLEVFQGPNGAHDD